MTIKVYRDRIELGNYTLTATPTGASFNGSIAVSKLGNNFTVGQGKSFAYKHGAINSWVGPSSFTASPVTVSSYRFPFVSDQIIQDVSSFNLVPINNVSRGTYHSSETHGYTTKGAAIGSVATAGRANYFNGFSSWHPASSNGLQPITRYSFSSFAGSEDIGALSQTLNPFNSATNHMVSVPSFIGFSSKENGYVGSGYFPGFFSPVLGLISTRIGLVKFSFSDSSNKAVLFQEDTRLPSVPTAPNIDSAVATPNWLGTSLSNENYGYFINSKSVTVTPQGSIPATFYRKFPFITESQLFNIGTLSTNPTEQSEQYMTGITGPTAGYWVSGQPEALNGSLILTPTSPPISPTQLFRSQTSSNKTHKFPFATDVISVISHTPEVGFAYSGSSSETKGYLLNGYVENALPPLSVPFQVSNRQFTSIVTSDAFSPVNNVGVPFIFQIAGGFRKSFSFSSEATMVSLTDGLNQDSSGGAHQQ
jgi:hypothetical protein